MAHARNACTYVLVTVVAALLAGCLGGGGTRGIEPGLEARPGEKTFGADDFPPAEAEDVQNVPGTVGGRVAERLRSASSPVWAPGRFWTYDYRMPMNDTAESTVRMSLVVVENGPHYRVATDNAEVAYDDAFYNDLPFLGEVRTSDLAPVVGGVGYPLVQWPLTDGAHWTLPDRHGRAVSFAASYAAAISLGGEQHQGFEVSAVLNGTLLYAFTYVPEVRWFASFEEFDPDSESENNRVMKLELVGFGERFDGEVVDLQVERLFYRAFYIPGHTRESIKVPADLSGLFVYMHLISGNSIYSIQGYENATLFDPANDVAMWHDRFMVYPLAWDAVGSITSGTFCEPPPAAAPLKALLANGCRRPLDGNPFRPYDYNYTALLSPQAGPWTLLVQHAGSSDVRATVGVVAVKELWVSF